MASQLGVGISELPPPPLQTECWLGWSCTGLVQATIPEFVDAAVLCPEDCFTPDLWFLQSFCPLSTINHELLGREGMI